MIGKAYHYGLEQYWLSVLDHKDNPEIIILNQEDVTKHAVDFLKDEIRANQAMGIGDLADDKGIKLETLKELIDLAEIEEEDSPDKIDALAKLKKKKIDLDDIRAARRKYIDWGKTGNPKDAEESVKQAVANYFNELPNYNPLFTEQAETVDFVDIEGRPMPIPLKGVVDLIAEDEDGEIIVVDHKAVYKHADPETDKAQYELQAGAYFFIAQALTGRIPKAMIFDEVVKTAPSAGTGLLQKQLRELCDKHGIDWATGNNGKYMTNDLMKEALIEVGELEKPQARKPIVINYTEKPDVVNAFLKIYKLVVNRIGIMSLYDIPLEFLPNPFAMYSGEQSWADFKAELDNEKTWKDTVAAKKENEDFINKEELDF